MRMKARNIKTRFLTHGFVYAVTMPRNRCVPFDKSCARTARVVVLESKAVAEVPEPIPRKTELPINDRQHSVVPGTDQHVLGTEVGAMNRTGEGLSVNYFAESKPNGSACHRASDRGGAEGGVPLVMRTLHNLASNSHARAALTNVRVRRPSLAMSTRTART
jgi:hypothetical protein